MPGLPLQALPNVVLSYFLNRGKHASSRFPGFYSPQLLCWSQTHIVTCHPESPLGHLLSMSQVASFSSPSRPHSASIPIVNDFLFGPQIYPVLVSLHIIWTLFSSRNIFFSFHSPALPSPICFFWRTLTHPSSLSWDVASSGKPLGRVGAHGPPFPCSSHHGIYHTVL